MRYHIFVRTPMKKDSNHIAHVIEHCLMRAINGNEKDFFHSYMPSEASTYADFTEYECNSKVVLKRLLQSFNNKISEDDYKFEIKKIKNELSEPIYRKKLCNAIYKKLYGKGSILTTPSYSHKEVNDYKDTHYKNFIITNSKFDIIDQKRSFNNKAKNEKDNVSAINLSVDGRKNKLIIKPFLSSLDRYTFDYISKLMNARLEYYHATQKPLFYYDTTIFFALKGHVVVCVPREYIDLIETMSVTFYKEFQQYYLKYILSGRGNIISLIYAGNADKLPSIKKKIHQLSLKEMQEMWRVS